MKIILANSEDKNRWNNFCKKHNSLPSLSRFEWNNILNSTYNVNTFPILSLDEKGVVTGILPIYKIIDYAGMPNFYSLKFGLIADSDLIANDLVSFAHRLSQEQGASNINISSGYKFFPQIQNQTITKTITLDILESEDEMWNKIRGKARNMIKKARKDNLVIEQGINNLKEFYSIYSYRMLEKGVRIHSSLYFQNIIEHIGDKVELFIARKDSKIIGGMFMIYSGDTAAYIYGGSMVNRGTSPNQLLLWEMVRFCIGKKIKFLDLGESIEGTGVYNFKIWFGGAPKNIYNYNFSWANENKFGLSKALNFLRRDFLRYSSYLILRHGTLGLKRRVGIWKRQKGPLQ
tara:strand:- start:8265 stop:9302 length:1038 start_codon:yes stop_codon:yes gene_type:complete